MDYSETRIFEQLKEDIKNFGFDRREAFRISGNLLKLAYESGAISATRGLHIADYVLQMERSITPDAEKYNADGIEGLEIQLKTRYVEFRDNNPNVYFLTPKGEDFIVFVGKVEHRGKL